jgi:beta-aspartyl-peptidase (threonine type)
MRLVAAYDVSARMAYGGMGCALAAQSFIDDKLGPLGGRGGLIVVDAHGNVSMPFNTEGMYRGYARVGETPVTAIYDDEGEGAAPR